VALGALAPESKFESPQKTLLVVVPGLKKFEKHYTGGKIFFFARLVLRLELRLHA
jgi:hypothetical protein